MLQSVVFDTNILLNDPTIIPRFYSQKKYNIIIPSAVLEEIDGLKKNTEIGHKARQVNNIIDELENDISFEIKDIYDDMPSGWDVDKRDNKIVICAKDNNAILYTNDTNVRNKARCLGIEVYSENKMQGEDDVYRGYKTLRGDTDFINKLFDDINNGINEYGFIVNEYLILENTDLDNVYEFRFDGSKFIDLKLPSSKIIKGLNPEQRCALDLLNDKDITIKAILGKHGSGKTFLSLRMALYQVREKGTYAKVLAVREPIAEGTQIGYLKGDFEDKTKYFYKPIENCLDGGEFDLQSLIAQGILEKNIPLYLKGTTYNETIIVVDEAEDLSTKQLQTIGTRVGKNGAVTFCGDYKQAIKMANSSNPLVLMCKKLKGNDKFGCLVLPEDIRSETSKIFADLWETGY